MARGRLRRRAAAGAGGVLDVLEQCTERALGVADASRHVDVVEPAGTTRRRSATAALITMCRPASARLGDGVGCGARRLGRRLGGEARGRRRRRSRSGARSRRKWRFRRTQQAANPPVELGPTRARAARVGLLATPTRARVAQLATRPCETGCREVSRRDPPRQWSLGVISPAQIRWAASRSWNLSEAAPS